MDIPRKSNGRKIEAMHNMFGVLNGKCCADCCHIRCYTHNNRNYWKCSLYGISSSVATDWVKGWTACKAFNVMTINKKDIYKTLARTPREDKSEQLEGQISLWT